MQGLEGLTNLEEIYLSHNGLTKIEGLEHNVSTYSLAPYPADANVAKAHNARYRE